MNGIIVRVFAVGLLVAVGHALQCYKCDWGIFKMCLTSNVTCSAGQQCFSGTGTAAGIVDIMMKGCLATADCNKTSSATLPGSLSNSTVYSMTKTCCDTDLCNAAPGPNALPLLPLFLATLTSLFMATALV